MKMYCMPSTSEFFCVVRALYHLVSYLTKIKTETFRKCIEAQEIISKFHFKNQLPNVFMEKKNISNIFQT